MFAIIFYSVNVNYSVNKIKYYKIMFTLLHYMTSIIIYNIGYRQVYPGTYTERGSTTPPPKLFFNIIYSILKLFFKKCISIHTLQVDTFVFFDRPSPRNFFYVRNNQCWDLDALTSHKKCPENRQNALKDAKMYEKSKHLIFSF